jgi:hypothetical protein
VHSVFACGRFRFSTEAGGGLLIVQWARYGALRCTIAALLCTLLLVSFGWQMVARVTNAAARNFSVRRAPLVLAATRRLRAPRLCGPSLAALLLCTAAAALEQAGQPAAQAELGTWKQRRRWGQRAAPSCLTAAAVASLVVLAFGCHEAPRKTPPGPYGLSWLRQTQVSAAGVKAQGFGRSGTRPQVAREAVSRSFPRTESQRWRCHP